MLSALRAAFVAVELPGHPAAQAELDAFLARARGRDERTREREAEPLLAIDGLPVVRERADTWYLVQLASMDRHVSTDGRPIALDLATPEVVHVAPFVGARLDPWLGGARARQAVDRFLAAHREPLLAALGLDPATHAVTHLPVDVLTRAPPALGLGAQPRSVHLDGLRLRPSGRRTGLVGGHASFGGARFVDSIWLEHDSPAIDVTLVARRIRGSDRHAT